MIEQGVDDPGDLSGGFYEVIAGPDPEHMGDGSGVEFGLIVVAPDSQALELVDTLLHDGLLQKMVKPPFFDQRQPIRLAIQIGVDRQDVLIDPAGGQGDGAVDLGIHIRAVLPDHILRQIEVPVKGGSGRQNSIEKAAVELCGFDKTELLEPGASETVTITVDKEEFRTYDTYGAGTYIMDEGDYFLTIGT
ncbi:MAG: fibronectin type III-like domain-contianing protein, partial [Oscillospiraceae bacterium]|nr:fibronectin type III-like domain-contianing protein [Oscillospiraceae bacterium]